MELDEFEYEGEQEGKPVWNKNPWASDPCKKQFGAKQNLKASFAGGVKIPIGTMLGVSGDSPRMDWDPG